MTSPHALAWLASSNNSQAMTLPEWRKYCYASWVVQFDIRAYPMLVHSPLSATWRSAKNASFRVWLTAESGSFKTSVWYALR